MAGILDMETSTSIEYYDKPMLYTPVQIYPLTHATKGNTSFSLNYSFGYHSYDLRHYDNHTSGTSERMQECKAIDSLSIYNNLALMLKYIRDGARPILFVPVLLSAVELG
jgi:hypothetical protein